MTVDRRRRGVALALAALRGGDGDGNDPGVDRVEKDSRDRARTCHIVL